MNSLGKLYRVSWRNKKFYIFYLLILYFFIFSIYFTKISPEICYIFLNFMV